MKMRGKGRSASAEVEKERERAKWMGRAIRLALTLGYNGARLGKRRTFQSLLGTSEKRKQVREREKEKGEKELK